MRLKFTLFVLIGLFSTQLNATNNSIVYIYNSGHFCEHVFRDTAGTRTFTPNAYYWDFGDGFSSSTQHAKHDYLANGNYTVKHIISDGVNWDTAEIAIAINCKANLPLTSHFIADKVDSLISYIFNFSFDGNGRPDTYLWDFGNGILSSKEAPTNHYYPFIFQSYNVCLLVEDGVNSDTFCQNVYVIPRDTCKDFFASFGWKKDTVCNGIVFINYSDTSADNFVWSFGDGNNSNEKNPVHYYGTGVHQTYNVQLKASNNLCAQITETKIKPSCRNCISSTAYIYLYSTPSDPSKAYLYNHSEGKIKSHFWDFGDGDTSTLAEPKHVYTNPGQIHLVYIVTDSLNCKDTFDLYFEIDSLGHIKRGNIEFTLQVIDKTHSTSINKKLVKSFSFLVYPNPSDAEINIQNLNSIVSNLTIFDSFGKKVLTKELLGGELNTLNTKAWTEGLYLLIDDNGNAYRFMVLH